MHEEFNIISDTFSGYVSQKMHSSISFSKAARTLSGWNHPLIAEATAASRRALATMGGMV